MLVFVYFSVLDRVKLKEKHNLSWQNLKKCQFFKISTCFYSCLTMSKHTSKIFLKPQRFHIGLDKNRPLTIWGPATPLFMVWKKYSCLFRMFKQTLPLRLTRVVAAEMSPFPLLSLPFVCAPVVLLLVCAQHLPRNLSAGSHAPVAMRLRTRRLVSARARVMCCVLSRSRIKCFLSFIFFKILPSIIV